MKAGRLSACYKMNLADPRVAEIASSAGADALWLCNEHVPNDWLTLEAMIRAAALHDTDALVRVSKGSYSDYIRPLEAGAAGIIVPHVANADEAREIVRSVRFHPLGQRPLDGGNADAGYGRVPLPEYIEFTNHDRLLILQIESPEALGEVDAIAAVEGFDLLMFGPGDYAHRIGRADDPSCSEVDFARRRVEEAARAHGKRCVAVGALGTGSELWERGYAIVHTGADVIALGNAVREAIRPFKPQDAETAATSIYE